MQRQRKTVYIPPRVLQQASVRLEKAFLNSIVDNLNAAGVYTTFQVEEHLDFDVSEDFNFKWE